MPGRNAGTLRRMGRGFGPTSSPWPSRARMESCRDLPGSCATLATGRERFTLAHELGHLILGHGEYLRAESFDTQDLETSEKDDLESDMIRRLEWQANRFASSLLLPRRQFARIAMMKAESMGIRDKGFGLIYRDHQPENQLNYMRILSLEPSASRNSNWPAAGMTPRLASAPVYAQAACCFSFAGSKRSPFFHIFNAMAAIFRARTGAPSGVPSHLPANSDRSLPTDLWKHRPG